MTGTGRDGVHSLEPGQGAPKPRLGAAESQCSPFFGANLSDKPRIRADLPLGRAVPVWGLPVPEGPCAGTAGKQAGVLWLADPTLESELSGWKVQSSI